MDLITLNDKMQPAKLVGGYDSLIWTERFNTVSDFQMVAGDPGEVMRLLPEGTVISLRESNMAMIVETHKIERKKNSGAKITVTGRSFESILDRRVSVNTIAAPPPEWKVVAKIPSDVAYFIIKQICVDGIVDPADIFPADKVQFNSPLDYLTTTGPNREFVVPRGNLLSTVLGLIQTEASADPTTNPPTPKIPAHGIRSMRPNASGTAIAIEIYKGEDRASTIRYDATRDLLDDGTYLLSKVGSANAAYLLGQNYSGKMNQIGTVATGFDRRVILVDSGAAGVDTQEGARAEGSRRLSEAHVTAAFDGVINEDLSPYLYGVDFYLGDIVRLVGDYGLETRARMVEYIRSEDATGRKSYPTFQAVPDYI